MKIIGVYSITNVLDGKKYIGSSSNIEFRQYTHWSCLRRNKHKNSYLQNAYNKYGKDNFVFEIIETTSYCELFEREQYWIHNLKSSNRKFGYNIISEVVNNKMSDETKIKLSTIMKKKYANGWLPTFKNHKHTNETKKLIGYKSSQKPLTENYLNHLLEANRLSNLVSYKPILQFDKNGNFIREHKSINAAVEFLFPEMDKTNIRKKRKGTPIGNCCNKKSKSAFGYKFKFKNDI